MVGLEMSWELTAPVLQGLLLPFFGDASLLTTAMAPLSTRRRKRLSHQGGLSSTLALQLRCNRVVLSLGIEPRSLWGWSSVPFCCGR